MGTRVLEVGLAVAATLSAALLAVMLAAPLLPQPSAPQASPAPSPSATPAAALPPIGLFQMRTAFSFGPCLAVELSPESYPVAEGEGSARVLWWIRGMTGCDTRTGEVEEVTARTVVVLDSDEPATPPIGYTLTFSVPLEGGPQILASISILARQSTDDLLQAVESAPGSGQGYVFDRVSAVDPPLNPLPSQAPSAVVPPNGIFLLQGPLSDDGPCLVLELGQPSYPTDADAEGTARVRSWEPAVRNDDPAQCLMRAGEIQEAEASVTAVLDSDGSPLAYEATFAVLGPGGAPRPVEIAFDAAQRTPDRLEATIVEPDIGIRVFDRVDSIEPPLGTPAPTAP